VTNNTLRHVRLLGIGLMLAGIGFPSQAEAGLGKLWPFASKKHIKQQVDPVSGRVSELEEVNRQHSARIKDIDERTQAGIQQARTQVEAADVKAIAAGNNAGQAGTAAGRAYASVGDTERRLVNRLENVENYRAVRTLQVNFKPSQTEVDVAAFGALDELATELKGSKGYVLEIQGFADPTGAPQANVEISQKRARSVVRYLFEKHEVPLFRMRTIGMGATNAVKDESGHTSRVKSRRVEIRLLRNDATEVASK